MWPYISFKVEEWLAVEDKRKGTLHLGRNLKVQAKLILVKPNIKRQVEEDAAYLVVDR